MDLWVVNGQECFCKVVSYGLFGLSLSIVGFKEFPFLFTSVRLCVKLTNNIAYLAKVVKNTQYAQSFCIYWLVTYPSQSVFAHFLWSSSLTMFFKKKKTVAVFGTLFYSQGCRYAVNNSHTSNYVPTQLFITMSQLTHTQITNKRLSPFLNIIIAVQYRYMS